VALTRHELGWAYFFAGDDASARTQMEESLRIQATIGDELLTNRAQLGLLQVLVAMGELDEVKRLGQQALELSQKLGDVYYEHFAHHFLADCSLMEGRYEDARDGYRRSLDAAWRSGDRVETTYEIQGSAMAAAGLGQPELALRLSAAADASLAALGVEHLVEFWSRLNDDHVARARAQIGAQRADAAWQEGREIPLERAVELAAGGEA